MNYDHWNDITVSSRRDSIEYFKELYFTEIIHPEGYEDMFVVLLSNEKLYPMKVSVNLNGEKELSYFRGIQFFNNHPVMSRVYFSHEYGDKINEFFDLFLLSDL